MIARDTLYSSPGGDTIQIVSTAKYLRLIDIDVDIKLASEHIEYRYYDLIHFFNIIRPDDILPHLRLTTLPFVVSTIFVDYSEYEKRNRSGFFGLLTKILNGDQLEYIKSIARFFKNGDKIKSLDYFVRGHRASIKRIAKKTAGLLPNSHSEYRRFVTKYNVNSSYVKVPNAIDIDLFNRDIVSNELFRDHVICVGRIEGRKNQLNLIKALVGSDLKLTIIGKPSPNHLSYYEACKAIVNANSNMQIIEHIDQKDLSGIYKAAKVHVLPSWFETTGLSSLEAGAMKCNLVVTRKGDTEEYFQEMAYYCEPDSLDSIKKAVIAAYNNPVNENLNKHIYQNYNWAQAAQETFYGYRLALSK